MIVAYGFDDDEENSEKSPEASPRSSSSPARSSPPPVELTNSTTTITVNTSVTVVVRKTIQRQATKSLIGNYGTDSDEDAPSHFVSDGGAIDVIASPKPTNKPLQNASDLRLMRLLPPEPLGEVDREIQDKIAGYLKMGRCYNTQLQGMKNFHNPYVLNKIAEKYGINQTASNYPPELYDPQEWEREDYERIARRQEHVLKEKAQQDETKQFVMPAAPIPLSSSSSGAPGLRRWDSQPGQQPPNKKAKSTPVQHALQVANQLKASLSSGAIDASAAAKKEAAARALVIAAKKN